MILNILAVGDVVSQSGIDFLSQHLRKLKAARQIGFVVVNGENADGVGILPKQAEAIFSAGADVITLGNHAWGRRQIFDTLEDCPYLLRPANYAPGSPGRGFGVYEGPRGLRIGVMNLIGRCRLEWNADNPFSTADRILRDRRADADIFLVDFHAEVTSEKLALFYYLDGRVQALWGTHTHVPTADVQISPKGTGYVTDLGMAGPAHSVIGVKSEQSVAFFLSGVSDRFLPAEGDPKLESVLFSVDTASGRCIHAERLDIR